MKPGRGSWVVGRGDVEVLNEQNLLPVNKKKTIELIMYVLKKEGSPEKGVTLLISDDENIRKYNRKYFKKNEATDVIAFNASTAHDSRLTTHDYLGDVIVSAETALREHHHYHSTAETEFMRYVVHGVLHLLGYRDKRPAEFREMHARQEEYLKGFAMSYDVAPRRMTGSRP